MTRPILLLSLLAAGLFAAAPDSVFAYGGPGSVISGIGAFLAAVAAVLALGLPLGIVWVLGRLGVGSFWGTMSILERLDFLAGVTVVGGAGYFLMRRFYRP